MKKIFIMSLFALLFIQACKKDQQLIDNKRPEERVAEAINKYSSALTGSQEGWVATIKTTVIEGTYSFYMKFNESSRVTMWADYDSDALESTYRIKYVMAPSIIFDTYSSLHYLQDPNPNSFGGVPGQGYGSDFEFEIREQVGDTIKLIGKKRLAELSLVKATTADKEFYTNTIASINKYLSDNPYLYIPDPKDNTNKIQVSINIGAAARSVTLTSLQNNTESSESAKFLFSTKTGLILSTPLTYSGLKIVAVSRDSATGKLFLVTATGEKIEILISNVPILPLYLVLGSVYSTVVVPKAATYPGWGADFVTRRAATATGVARFSVGGAPLTLDVIAFDFPAPQKMNVIFVTTYGTSALQLGYSYTYTKTATGVYKFSGGAPADGNANALAASMAPILQRIASDTFTVAYFAHPTTGAILGQFKSVENPTFTFTGPLE